MKTKIMFPSLLLGAVVSIVPMSSLVRAQEAPPPPQEGRCNPCPMNGGQPGGNPLEMLSNRLALTEDQKAKIKPILEEGMPQVKAIHEEAQAKMKAAMEGMHNKIKPILTPEQQQKLEELKQQMLERHQGMGKGMQGMRGHGQMHGAPNGGFGGKQGSDMGERLAKELNLTPDQQNQIKPITEETRSQMKALWADNTLTPDQKKAKGKELRDASQAKIKALLTPDQQKKMEQMKENRPWAGKQE